MESAPIIGQIVSIYDEYVAAVKKYKSERKFTDGLMGFGTKEDSFPCHNDFVQKLSDELNIIAQSGSTQEEADEVLRFIYEAPLNNKKYQSAYWMMMAVHSLTEGLFPLISDEQAAELAKWYAEIYPPYDRLPAQIKILKALQSRGKSGKNK
ncbi:MAG TPA: hypothetical protein PKI60_04935 [Oscillospiraceae bacterium]|nr:hypothetical protein [Oscillospiraceae bacterium]